ncbi:MBL fold metallo-hydrolase [Streptomyces sp. NPDC057301]|uniref:MBL fold metallo-hydrolase n=1 Tax=Streptomyces sp. NPDC057301 TaxID=3346093 RepID=UPI0036357A39
MNGYEASLTTLANGVHAWVQPDGSWWVNNAGVIETADGVILVVDTCATETRTRALLAAAHSVTRGKPIAAAFNTHAHGDHTYGNSLLPPEAMIIGHEHTRHRGTRRHAPRRLPADLVTHAQLGERHAPPPEPHHRRHAHTPPRRHPDRGTPSRAPGPHRG